MEPQVLRMTEADLARDLHAVLQRVRTGAEVIIESDEQPFAVLRSAELAHRTLAECLAFAQALDDNTAVVPQMDVDFVNDLQEIIESRKPWNPPNWD